jgi:hypothetical protein
VRCPASSRTRAATCVRLPSPAILHPRLCYSTRARWSGCVPIPAAEAWFSPARFPSQTGQCCACTPANMNSQPSAGWRHAPATDAWPRTCWQKFSSDLHELGRRLLLAAEEKRHDYSRASAHPGQIQTLRASNSRFECDGHLPARTSKRSRNEFWVHPECKQVPRARWRYTRQSGDDMWRLAERSTPWQAEVALSAYTSSCQPPTSLSPSNSDHELDTFCSWKNHRSQRSA